MSKARFLSKFTVYSANIADGTISADDLASNSVTENKIASNAVTSTKVADNAITDEKLSANLSANIAQGTAPKITTISYPNEDLAASPDGGDTIVITGSGFLSGATVYFGATVAPSVSYTNTTSLSVTTPALSVGSYLIYVINPDGSTGIGVPGLQISGTPTWNTTAGALTNATEDAYSETLNAESDSTVTYSIFTGALPEGLTLNANTGVISGVLAGNVANLSSNTSYNFTVSASDQELQNTERSFSILYVPTFPTWYTPAEGELTAGQVDVAYTVTLNAISNSNVTYTIPSGNLIANLDVSGNVISGTPPEANTYYFTVRATDEEGHYTDRAFSLNIAVGADTYFNQTVLLLQGSEPFTADASTNNLLVRASGRLYADSFSPYNSTFSVNNWGSSSAYLQMGSNAALQLGSGDFTVECWAYFTTAGSSGGNENVIMDVRPTSTTGDYFNFGLSNQTVYWDNGTGSYPLVSSTVTLNTWHHIAIVRSSGSSSLYVDGSLAAGPVSDSVNYSCGSTNRIGNLSYFSSGDRQFNGAISNLRITKGGALYSGSSFTVPTSPLTTSVASGTVTILACQSNRFIEVASSLTITVNGSPQISGFIPFADTDTTTGSVYIPKTSSVYEGLFLTDSALWDFGTNQFVIEGWFYPQLASSTGYVCCRYEPSNASWYIGIESGTLIAYLYGEGGSTSSVYSGTGYNLNGWNHFALTGNGSTNDFYLNGIRVGTQSAIEIRNVTAGVAIGTLGNYSSYDIPFKGWISNIKIATGTCYYTGSSITVPTEPLTDTTGTQLLTLQNRTPGQNFGFLDTTKQSTITTYGNVTQGTFSPFSQASGYWSNYFDGSSSYLNTSSAVITTSDFTIEAWVYLTTYSKYATIYSQGTSLQSGRTLLYVEQSTGKLGLQITSTVLTSSSSIPLNQWVYVAATRSSGSTTIYINGTSVGTSTNSDAIQNTAVRIGLSWTSGEDFTGYISNVRVSNTARSITSSPTAPFSNDGNTVFLTCQANRFVDSSAGLAITVNGSPSVQSFGPFAPTDAYDPDVNGGSGYFDGSGDYLVISDNNDSVNFGTGAFTVECWFYWTSLLSSTRSFITKGIGGADWQLYKRSTSSAFTWYNGSNAQDSGVVPILNQWNHLAYVRDSSNHRGMFINGTRILSGTDAVNYSGTGGIAIGGDNVSSGSDSPQGYMTQFRLVKGTAVYDPTQTTVPIPTEPLTDISGTGLLVNFTNAGIIDGTGRNVLETVSTAQLVSNIKKFNTGSYYFAQNGSPPSALVARMTPDLQLLGDDWTIEFWVYANSWSITDIVGSWKSGEYSWIIQINGTTLTMYNSLSTSYTFNSTFNTSTWYHVALASSGLQLKCFVNGNQIGSTQSISAFPTATRPLYIGYNEDNGGSANSFNGYIDELRITKGVARYTDNFPPPTEALKNK